MLAQRVDNVNVSPDFVHFRVTGVSHNEVADADDVSAVWNHARSSVTVSTNRTRSSNEGVRGSWRR